MARELAEVPLGLQAEPAWSRLTLFDLVERPALDPDKPAIVFEGRVRTYGDLRDRSRRVANGLGDLGVRPFDRVAVLANNCLEYLELELGIAGRGAIMVSLGWRLSPPEIENLLRRSRACVILVDEAFVELAAALRDSPGLPDLRSVVVLGDQGPADIGYEAFCAGASPARPEAAARLEDPHEIIYTSGTTGEPKGAVWSHGGVIWNSIQQVMDFGIRAEHVSYVLNDLHYIGGRHDFTWAMIHQGATVHVRRAGGFDAADVVEYVARHRVTHTLWVPTMLYEILRVPGLERHDLSCLRMIMCGGQPLPVPVIEAAQRAFPHTDFTQVFGLTEGGGTVTSLPAEYAVSKIGSCGKATVHNELRVVDGRGEDCPPGTAGEILVRGPAVTPGYWEAPEATRAAIVDGWLHTGDVGYLDEDGFLFVSGRQKDMIISGGMNIYPAEVEAVLMQHPAIRAAAVIGVDDEKWGERVCAVLVPEAGAAIDEDELAAFCRGRLAGYKRPTILRLVDALPMTASGKVQKFVLRERYGDGG